MLFSRCKCLVREECCPGNDNTLSLASSSRVDLVSPVTLACHIQSVAELPILSVFVLRREFGCSPENLEGSHARGGWQCVPDTGG